MFLLRNCQNTGISSGGSRLIPKEILLLNKMWFAGNMSNAFEILHMNRKDVEALRKICFIEKYACVVLKRVR